VRIALLLAINEASHSLGCKHSAVALRDQGEIRHLDSQVCGDRPVSSRLLAVAARAKSLKQRFAGKVDCLICLAIGRQQYRAENHPYGCCSDVIAHRHEVVLASNITIVPSLLGYFL